MNHADWDAVVDAREGFDGAELVGEEIGHDDGRSRIPRRRA